MNIYLIFIPHIERIFKNGLYYKSILKWKEMKKGRTFYLNKS